MPGRKPPKMSPQLIILLYITGAVLLLSGTGYLARLGTNQAQYLIYAELIKDFSFILLTAALFYSLIIHGSQSFTKSNVYEKEDRYRVLMELIPDGFIVFRLGHILYINHRGLEMLGMTSLQELIGKPIDKIIPPDQMHSIVHHSGNGHRDPRHGYWSESKFIHGNGTLFDVEYTVYPMEIDGDKSYHMIFRDMTRQLKSEQARQEIERRFHQFSEGTYEGIIILENGKISDTNRGCLRLIGFEIHEMVNKDALDFIVPDYREFLRQKLELKEEFPYECAFIKKDGSYLPVELRIKSIIYAGKEIKVISFYDISDRKKLEDRLFQLSIRDDLTGLNNRRGFYLLAEQALKSARRDKQNILLMFSDLDGLKDINDSQGHLEGDRALIETAQMMKKTFRDADIIARVGGDEFVALATNSDTESEEIFSKRLQAKLYEYNISTRRTYPISISYGFTEILPEDTRSLDQIMAKADEIMYEHKRKTHHASTRHT